MLLSELLEEFKFNCERRRLSPKTTENYQKQIRYLLDFLKADYNVLKLEDVQPKQIKAFLMKKMKEGRKPAYINDLLKAYKVFFRYLKDEGYTEKAVTDAVKNVKQPKVIIKTFTPAHIKGILAYYNADCIFRNG